MFLEEQLINSCKFKSTKLWTYLYNLANIKVIIFLDKLWTRCLMFAIKIKKLYN